MNRTRPLREPGSGFEDDPPPWCDRPAFALDADLTVWWPEVRPCWEEARPSQGRYGYSPEGPPEHLHLGRLLRPSHLTRYDLAFFAALFQPHWWRSG